MRKLCLAVSLVVLSARCASIAHGRYQRVPVTSTPSGAAIRVDCGDAPADGAVTPAAVMLRRGAEHCVITLSKAGYTDRTLTFTRVLSHTAWVNFVPGVVLGLASGAAVAIGTAFDDSGRSNARPNEAALGGIVVGTGVGLLVDRSTGAIFRQVPSSVDVALEPRP